MKTIEEPVTLRNTQKQSGSQCSFKLIADKGTSWYFLPGTVGMSIKQATCDRPAWLTIAAPIGAIRRHHDQVFTSLVLKNPYHTQEEKPDFTEADKEWISKIDRTKLTLEDW